MPKISHDSRRAVQAVRNSTYRYELRNLVCKLAGIKKIDKFYLSQLERLNGTRWPYTVWSGDRMDMHSLAELSHMSYFIVRRVFERFTSYKVQWRSLRSLTKIKTVCKRCPKWHNCCSTLPILGAPVTISVCATSIKEQRQRSHNRLG